MHSVDDLVERVQGCDAHWSEAREHLCVLADQVLDTWQKHEETVVLIRLIPQGRNSECVNERIVDISEERDVEVVKVIPKERLQQFRRCSTKQQKNNNKNKNKNQNIETW